MQQVQDNQGIRPGQPGFRKCRSCSAEGQEGFTEGSGQVGSMCPGQLCEVPQCQMFAPAQAGDRATGKWLGKKEVLFG